MIKIETSTKIYLGLLLLLATLSAINVFLPQGELIDQYELPASKPIMALAIFFIMLVMYGIFGLIGLKLSKKLEIAEIWDKKVSNKQRFLIPLVVGVLVGILFIVADFIFSKFNTIGAMPHPPFPTSIISSITAAIGEETIFRLFYISFWVWLISSVILRGRWQNVIFWIFAVISSLTFAIGHLPSLMMVFGYDTFAQIPIVLVLQIFLLNGILSLLAALYFKKYGLLAAIGIHFWADIVWHVIYGGILSVVVLAV